MKKIAVVTGANAGLGFQISLALARDGMRVVMACRNMQKAEAAKNDLLAQCPDADLVLIPLDLSEPDSIRHFNAQFWQRIGVLDLLVNNAGIVGLPLQRNSHSQELHLATNYLGAFALTGRLMPFFRKDLPTRIVNVGSLAHLFGQLDFDDFNWEVKPYNQWKAYARSKLALATFTIELGRRLARTNSRTLALAAHPGFAATEILGERVTNPGNAFTKWYYDQTRKWIPLPENAARSIVHAARVDTVASGDYYGPGGLFGISGAPAKARLSVKASDAEAAKRLWTLSETMSGVSYLPDVPSL
jgi:NAD(P)-dependent dehydrogenase (short-subunit alcohol dehydrogenase family)